MYLKILTDMRRTKVIDAYQKINDLASRIYQLQEQGDRERAKILDKRLLKIQRILQQKTKSKSS